MSLLGIWDRLGSVPVWVVDAVLGVLICGGVVGGGLGDGRGDGPAIVVAGVLAGGAVSVRRVVPLPALAAACLAGVLVTLVAVTEHGVATVALAGYAVGTRSGRGAAIAATVTGAALMPVGVVLGETVFDTAASERSVLLVASLAASVAVGYAVRSRRELTAALQERARHRAIEERLHIARELHDSVGHSIAVINVQAGVASQHLRDRPETAEEALGHVRGAARTVLDELSAVLSVLRDSGDQAASGQDTADTPAEPTPTLAELDRLIAAHRAAGTGVEWAVSGQPRELPRAVDLSAYRTIQESLTNAGRYGDGTVRLRLMYAPDEVTVEVRNGIRHSGANGPGEDSPGYGLIGMSERVAAAGGTLSAGPEPGGEFVVLARLPSGGRDGT